MTNAMDSFGLDKRDDEQAENVGANTTKKLAKDDSRVVAWLNKGRKLKQQVKEDPPNGSLTSSVHEPSKNPVSLLNELRPNVRYNEERSGLPHLPNFKICINVDDQEYTGTGNSKKEAKQNAATEALKHMNQHRTSTTLEDMSPVSLLNNLRKSLRYYLDRKYGPPHAPHFRMYVTVDGKTYFGSGKSMKEAKANAASKALNESGLLQSNREDSSASSQSSTSTSSVASGIEKTPFVVVNELYPLSTTSVRFNFEDPEKHVTFTLTIDGRDFNGVGPNKKIAKNDAAAKALLELKGFRLAGW